MNSQDRNKFADNLTELWKDRNPKFLKVVELIRIGASESERLLAYVRACDAELKTLHLLDDTWRL